jgi:hypothetical protein
VWIESLEPNSKTVIGWREVVALPQLGIRSIKAKVDTGARSSSVHAFDIECFDRHGVEWVRFSIYPKQRSQANPIRAEAPVLDLREIRSSTGQLQQRYVILTNVELMGQSWPIELTLASREVMGFRMLLGRQAIRGRMVVDPQRSFCMRHFRSN